MKYLPILLLLSHITIARQMDTSYYSMKGGEMKLSSVSSAEFYEVYNSESARNRIITQYYPEGIKRGTITYKNNLSHGAYKLLHRNGKTKETAMYSSGIPISLKRKYYENG